MNISHTQTLRFTHIAPPFNWPERLAWLLCAHAVVQVLLLHTLCLFDWTPLVFIGLALQPISSVGVILILLACAKRNQICWAWVFYTVAAISQIYGNYLQLNAMLQGQSFITYSTELIYTVAYVLTIFGTTLYLAPKSWWHGSVLRIFLDGAAVSAAALVILQSVLPLIVTPWSDSVNQAVYWLALDIGILFIFFVLGVRGRAKGEIPIGILFLSLICLIMANTILVLFSSRFAYSVFAVGPLYTLHRSLLALTISRRTISGEPEPAQPQQFMHNGEWLLWTTIPRFITLVAIAVNLVVHSHMLHTLLHLVVINTFREALAAYEQRREFRNLRASEAEAQRMAEQTERFIAEISHDVAVPYSMVQLAMDQMRLLTNHGTARSLVDLVHDQLAYLGQLIEQMRVYREARTVPLALATTDLGPLCSSVVDSMQPQAANRNIALSIVAPAHLKHIYTRVDALAIRRALNNLLMNALNATDNNGSIEVAIDVPSSSTVCISVRDTGCGIAPEHQERIFSPLFRLRPGGTGLGLPIVKALIEAMDGSISLTSAEGSGSTFLIQLPLISAEQYQRLRAQRWPSAEEVLISNGSLT